MRRASIYIYILYIELQIVQLGKERRRIRASVSRLYSYCRDDIYIYIYTYHGITNCIIVEKKRKEREC